jgi:DNA-binding beta-propeller fold protein YncE
MKRNCTYLLAVVITGLFPLISANALTFESVGAISDSLHTPTSLTVSDNQLTVLEPYANQLKVFSSQGLLSQRVSIEGNVVGLSRVGQTAYVFCDRSKNSIEHIDMAQGTQKTLISFEADQTDVTDVTVIDGRMFVLSAATPSILELTLDGQVVADQHLSGFSDSVTQYFSSFAVDPVLNRFYVLDQLNAQIWAVDASGSALFQCGGFGKAAGQITRGGELAVDRHGRIFATDRFQGVVSVFENDGSFLGIIDSLGTGGQMPIGIAVDDQDIVYVVLAGTARIAMFHVPHEISFDDAVVITPEYPAIGEELLAEDVSLMARAWSYDSSLVITGFDFELCGSDTLGQRLETIQNLRAELSEHQPDESVEVFATWSPTYDFGADQEYYWRTRVKTDETAGNWTEFNRFTVTSLPGTFALHQNYPNPFNPTTMIKYSIPEHGRVVLEVFNLLGQSVATLVDEVQPAGSHEVTWDATANDGSGVASGMYFYRLTTGAHSESKKMVLLK